MITPEQAKEYVQEMQRFTSEILMKRRGMKLDEALDLANDIVDYSFALMLRTYKGEKIKIVDDDIPF